MLPSELPELPVWWPIACDTETTGLHPDDQVQPEGGRGGISTVSVAWFDPDTDEVRAQAFAFDQGRAHDKLGTPEVLTLFGGDDANLPESEWESLLRWLAGRRLIFHNAPFDLRWLRHGTRAWPGRDLLENLWFDTAIGAKALWPDQPVALKASSARLELTGGDETETKDELIAWIKKAKLGAGVGTKKNPRYDLVVWDVMEPYARMDAELTIRLYRAEQLRLQDDEQPERWEVRRQILREHAMARTIVRLERRGMGFDVDGCLDAAARLEGRLAKLKAEMPFQPVTEDRARWWFFDHLVIQPPKMTKAKKNPKPSVDSEVRKLLIADGVEGAELYHAHEQIDRAISMWYRGWPGLVGPDGRIRASFRQLSVRSGRMSVERVQLHAIPKDDKGIEGVPTVRSFFTAKEGHTLWNLDLSQAELRVAARQANCERMLAMLLGGADLHGVTTQEVFGIDESHPEWKVKRDIAKRLTFGGIFNIGPQTFQRTLAEQAGIYWTLKESEQRVYRWRDAYPEYQQAYYWWMKQVERQGWIELINGERSYFWQYNDYDNTGWSRRVQGSLAVFVKRWLIATDRICERGGAPEALVNTVHDSVVLELPDEWVNPKTGKLWSGQGDHPVAKAVAAWAEQHFKASFAIEGRVDIGTWRSE